MQHPLHLLKRHLRFGLLMALFLGGTICTFPEVMWEEADVPTLDSG